MFTSGTSDAEVSGSDSTSPVTGIGNTSPVTDSGSHIITNKFNSDSLTIRTGIYVGNDYRYDKTFSEQHANSISNNYYFCIKILPFLLTPLVVYKLIKFIKKKQHSIEISKITLTELTGVYRNTMYMHLRKDEIY